MELPNVVSDIVEGLVDVIEPRIGLPLGDMHIHMCADAGGAEGHQTAL